MLLQVHGQGPRQQAQAGERCAASAQPPVWPRRERRQAHHWRGRRPARNAHLPHHSGTLTCRFHLDELLSEAHSIND